MNIISLSNLTLSITMRGNNAKITKAKHVPKLKIISLQFNIPMFTSNELEIANFLKNDSFGT